MLHYSTTVSDAMEICFIIRLIQHVLIRPEFIIDTAKRRITRTTPYDNEGTLMPKIQAKFQRYSAGL